MHFICTIFKNTLPIIVKNTLFSEKSKFISNCLKPKLKRFKNRYLPFFVLRNIPSLSAALQTNRRTVVLNGSPNFLLVPLTSYNSVHLSSHFVEVE